MGQKEVRSEVEDMNASITAESPSMAAAALLPPHWFIVAGSR